MGTLHSALPISIIEGRVSSEGLEKRKKRKCNDKGGAISHYDQRYEY